MVDESFPHLASMASLDLVDDPYLCSVAWSNERIHAVEQEVDGNTDEFAWVQLDCLLSYRRSLN